MVEEHKKRLMQEPRERSYHPVIRRGLKNQAPLTQNKTKPKRLSWGPESEKEFINKIKVLLKRLDKQVRKDLGDRELQRIRSAERDVQNGLRPEQGQVVPETADPGTNEYQRNLQEVLRLGRLNEDKEAMRAGGAGEQGDKLMPSAVATLRRKRKYDLVGFTRKSLAILRSSRDEETFRKSSSPAFHSWFEGRKMAPEEREQRELDARRLGHLGSHFKNLVEERARAGVDAVFSASIKKRIKRMQVDHVVDLQLGGADHYKNFFLLDGPTNQGMNHDLNPQIRDLTKGTIIELHVDMRDEAHQEES